MSKHNKHDKKTNVINRTTSETLRLGESDLRVLPQSASTSLSIQPLPQRKKIQTSSSSFQITAVSMTRVDFGDDSADDLDESHTDDISRVTDNETPSFSEDSRDTDDHQMCEPMPPPPPTTPSPSPNPQEPVPKPPDEEAGGRFKVVKMPSATPFSRGRWTCFDFLDNLEQNRSSEHRFQGASSSQATHVQEMQAFGSPHFATVQQQTTTPAATMKGYPQGYLSSVRANDGIRYAESTHIPGQEIIPEQKAANQPSNVNGQKDDILSDIKVALTSTPASYSGLDAGGDSMQHSSYPPKRSKFE